MTVFVRTINPLVTANRRQHRRHPELTCRCAAARFPHRAGSVPGCYGLDAYCTHGQRTAAHPDGPELCWRCEEEDWQDYTCDTVRDLRAGLF